MLFRSADEQLGEPIATWNQVLRRVDTVYALAFTRKPTAEERQLGIEALQQFEASWSGNSIAALESYCHTIFNSAEFLYVD